MKNRHITIAREKAEIYKEHYRPSLNLWRFTKSILSVLITGSGTAAPSFHPRKRDF